MEMSIIAILTIVSRGIELAQKLAVEGREKSTAEETASLLQSQKELEAAYRQLYPDAPLPGPAERGVAPVAAIER